MDDSSLTNRTWTEDWKRRVLVRIEASGCRTVTDFVATHPGEPYPILVKRLGDDVAPIQLKALHFSEATSEQMIRLAAMDSLARDLNAFLKDGWLHGAKDDFQTSRAYVVWVTRIQQKQTDLKTRADLVWDALEELRPTVGWLPAGPGDALIVKAFSRAWPGCFN